MFIATFPAGGAILKNLVEVIKEKDYIVTATFFVTKNGITMKAMDSSHVALVDLIIHPNAADSYQCDGSYQICVNLEAMSKILSCFSTNGILTLKFNENSPEVLTFLFQGTKKSKFQMKLLDVDSDDIQFSDYSHASENPLNALDLQKTFKDLAKFTEDVNITISGSMLTFVATGDVTDVAMDSIVTDKFNGTMSNTYSLRYLLWFAKASIISQECILGLDKEFPLKLEFENETMRMTFFLAAKNE